MYVVKSDCSNTSKRSFPETHWPAVCKYAAGSAERLLAAGLRFQQCLAALVVLPLLHTAAVVQLAKVVVVLGKMLPDHTHSNKPSSRQTYTV